MKAPLTGNYKGIIQEGNIGWDASFFVLNDVITGYWFDINKGIVRNVEWKIVDGQFNPTYKVTING